MASGTAFQVLLSQREGDTIASRDTSPTARCFGVWPTVGVDARSHVFSTAVSTPSQTARPTELGDWREASGQVGSSGSGRKKGIDASPSPTSYVLNK